MLNSHSRSKAQDSRRRGARPYDAPRTPALFALAAAACILFGCSSDEPAGAAAPPHEPIAEIPVEPEVTPPDTLDPLPPVEPIPEISPEVQRPLIPAIAPPTSQANLGPHILPHYVAGTTWRRHIERSTRTVLNIERGHRTARTETETNTSIELDFTIRDGTKWSVNTIDFAFREVSHQVNGVRADAAATAAAGLPARGEHWRCTGAEGGLSCVDANGADRALPPWIAVSYIDWMPYGPANPGISWSRRRSEAPEFDLPNAESVLGTFSVRSHEPRGSRRLVHVDFDLTASTFWQMLGDDRRVEAVGNGNLTFDERDQIISALSYRWEADGVSHGGTGANEHHIQRRHDTSVNIRTGRAPR